VVLLAAMLAAICLATQAQQPPQEATDLEREAMKKLSFLAGNWSGPITISHGAGEPLHFTQTEEIQYKLDGLVLLIEGTCRNTEGKVQFNALATVAYDDVSRSYRFRAYNAGHYIDTELTVAANGFSWGFDAGPAHITNTMHLTAKGEWSEVTEATVGSSPPQRSVDMLLQHQP
jgi:hypothetical protein